jgi:site-specific DNA-cytosine methylase
MVRRLNRDKLRAYGNAVVPQVVAAIARRILEIDAQSKP